MVVKLFWCTSLLFFRLCDAASLTHGRHGFFCCILFDFVAHALWPTACVFGPFLMLLSRVSEGGKGGGRGHQTTNFGPWWGHEAPPRKWKKYGFRRPFRGARLQTEFRRRASPKLNIAVGGGWNLPKKGEKLFSLQKQNHDERRKISVEGGGMTVAHRRSGVFTRKTSIFVVERLRSNCH